MCILCSGGGLVRTGGLNDHIHMDTCRAVGFVCALSVNQRFSQLIGPECRDIGDFVLFCLDKF